MLGLEVCTNFLVSLRYINSSNKLASAYNLMIYAHIDFIYVYLYLYQLEKLYKNYFMKIFCIITVIIHTVITNNIFVSERLLVVQSNRERLKDIMPQQEDVGDCALVIGGASKELLLPEVLVRGYCCGVSNGKELLAAEVSN